MKPEYHPSIPAELADVKPYGDFVLVRREPDRGPNLIVLPDRRNQPNPAEGVKRGTVLAVGPGDPLFRWGCEYCRGPVSASTWHAPKPCPICTRTNLVLMGIERHPMHVQPGDEVLYNRAPANHAVINGVEYIFLHEEQHVLAVLEKEA